MPACRMDTVDLSGGRGYFERGTFARRRRGKTIDARTIAPAAQSLSDLSAVAVGIDDIE